MAHQADGKQGQLRVALMALHDRAFFERLLNDPRSALADFVRQGKLELTSADIGELERLVEHAVKNRSVAEALQAWDQWKETGTFVMRPWIGIRGW